MNCHSSKWTALSWILNEISHETYPNDIWAFNRRRMVEMPNRSNKSFTWPKYVIRVELSIAHTDRNRYDCSHHHKFGVCMAKCFRCSRTDSLWHRTRKQRECKRKVFVRKLEFFSTSAIVKATKIRRKLSKT